jgi:hypothetical protein
MPTAVSNIARQVWLRACGCTPLLFRHRELWRIAKKQTSIPQRREQNRLHSLHVTQIPETCPSGTQLCCLSSDHRGTEPIPSMPTTAYSPISNCLHRLSVLTVPLRSHAPCPLSSQYHHLQYTLSPPSRTPVRSAGGGGYGERDLLPPRLHPHEPTDVATQRRGLQHRDTRK